MKTLLKPKLTASLLLALCALTFTSQAAPESFQISGVVSSFSAPNQSNTYGITVGSLMTGTITYDPAQPGYCRHPGDPATAYSVNFGGQPFLSFTIEGQQFEMFSTYLNVYFHGAGISYDAITTSYNGWDNTQVFSPWGNYVSGSLNQGDLTLQNDSGTALTDSQLPGNLNLADWPTRYIVLNEAPSASGGVEYGGFYLNVQLTSVVAAPEPKAVCLLAFAAGALWLRKAYRRSQSA